MISSERKRWLIRAGCLGMLNSAHAGQTLSYRTREMPLWQDVPKNLFGEWIRPKCCRKGWGEFWKMWSLYIHISVYILIFFFSAKTNPCIFNQIELPFVTQKCPVRSVILFFGRGAVQVRGLGRAVFLGNWSHWAASRLGVHLNPASPGSLHIINMSCIISRTCCYPAASPHDTLCGRDQPLPHTQWMSWPYRIFQTEKCGFTLKVATL